MNLESRWSFVREALKQAGCVLLTIFLLGAVGSGCVLVKQQVFNAVGSVTTACAVSLAVGPVATLLTLFDINDETLWVLTFVLILPYWACLGTLAGLFQWSTRDTNSEPIATGFFRWLTGSLRKTQSSNPSKQISNRIRWFIELTAVLLAFVFYEFGPIAGPTHVSHGRYSPGWIRNVVTSNLRQIDSAKQQLTIEKKLSPDYVPSESELLPYFRDGRFPRVGPEQYVLNSISNKPYAVLNSGWRFRRHGWRQGFTITNGTIFRLP